MRRTSCRLLAALIASTALCSEPVRAGSNQAAPAVSAPEAIVVDGWTGSVLFAKHPDALHQPASTVKIMTALIVLRHRIPLSRVVTVSWYAASMGGTTAGLYAGERITVWNLLHGMLLPSGNDAAVALAESVAGSAAGFVSMMNSEAWRLHLWHTRFRTPNGFDTVGQVTTARDLANLARNAMHYPSFVSVVGTRYWSAWSADRRILHRWSNLNKLLWSSSAINGVKTGTTRAAGACLVSSVKRNGKWVVAVNLGSSRTTRFSDGVALLNYGLSADRAAPSTR